MKKIAISFLAVVIFFMVSADASAIEYGQIGGKPAYPNPETPNSNSWFVYNLEAGKKIEDAIEIINLYQDDWDARVYAADSVKSAGGGFAVRQESEPKVQVGSWVKFYPDPKPDFSAKIFEKYKKIDEACVVGESVLRNDFELTDNQYDEFLQWCRGKESLELKLKGGEHLIVPFVFSVPQDAEVGEHTGGIIIQKLNKEEAQQQDGSRVLLTTRVGVRIYETVPGEVVKKLSFGDFSVTKNFEEFFLPWDGEKKAKLREYVISSVATNEGNSSVDFSEKITISNKFTGKEETIDGRSFQVLRGDKFSSILAWKAPAFGLLSFKKQYEYKDSDGSVQTVASEDISKWFIPWREIVFATMFILVLLAIFFSWKYFQKKRYGGNGWESYEVGFGETIIALAQKFQISWKVLAKTNKLKAPYLLEPGQTILVPPGFGVSSVELGAKEDKGTIQETTEKKEKKISAKEAKKTVFVKTEIPTKQEDETKRAKRIQMKLVSVLMILFTLLLVLAVVVLLVFLSNGGEVSVIKKNDSKKSNIAELALELPLEDKAQQESSSVESKSEEGSVEKGVTLGKEFSVVVLNGGAAPGSAGKTKEVLEKSGVKVSDALNADSRDNLGIKLYYISEAKEAAETIKKILDEKGAPVSLEENEKYKDKGDIMVILGK